MFFMQTKFNYLRQYRRKTRLNQSDISFLIGNNDTSIISRWEQGLRTPSTLLLVLYHLLFDVPVSAQIQSQSAEFIPAIKERLHLLIGDLKTKQVSQKIQDRISFLAETLTKLNS
jgi:transcriptional regulator with XRE-family HTH domain